MVLGKGSGGNVPHASFSRRLKQPAACDCVKCGYFCAFCWLSVENSIKVPRHMDHNCKSNRLSVMQIGMYNGVLQVVMSYCVEGYSAALSKHPPTRKTG